MTTHESPACCDLGDSGVTRRGLFRAAAATGGVMTFGSAVVATASATPGVPASSIIIVLSLRGAADGLSLVVPHGDPTYYKARPTISIPRASLLAKDATFGLHPALRPLLPMWRAGKLAAVHATGMRIPNRSHFAAMELVEDADPGRQRGSGGSTDSSVRSQACPPPEGSASARPPCPRRCTDPSPSWRSTDNRKVQVAGAEPSADPWGRVAARSTSSGVPTPPSSARELAPLLPQASTCCRVSSSRTPAPPTPHPTWDRRLPPSLASSSPTPAPPWSRSTRATGTTTPASARSPTAAC